MLAADSRDELKQLRALSPSGKASGWHNEADRDINRATFSANVHASASLNGSSLTTLPNAVLTRRSRHFLADSVVMERARLCPRFSARRKCDLHAAARWTVAEPATHPSSGATAPSGKTPATPTAARRNAHAPEVSARPDRPTWFLVTHPSGATR